MGLQQGFEPRMETSQQLEEYVAFHCPFSQLMKTHSNSRDPVFIFICIMLHALLKTSSINMPGFFHQNLLIVLCEINKNVEQHLAMFKESDPGSTH